MCFNNIQYTAKIRPAKLDLHFKQQMAQFRGKTVKLEIESSKYRN